MLLSNGKEVFQGFGRGKYHEKLACGILDKVLYGPFVESGSLVLDPVTARWIVHFHQFLVFRAFVHKISSDRKKMTLMCGGIHTFVLKKDRTVRSSTR